jgi:hypothetical protein
MRVLRAGMLLVGTVAIAATVCTCKSPAGPAEEKDLTLTCPKGGETFKAGDSVIVTWKTKAGVEFSSVYFKVSTDNGATWTESIINGSVPTGTGKWTWKVGSEYWPVSPAYPSNKCMLKILSYEPMNQYRDSSSVFAVTQ